MNKSQQASPTCQICKKSFGKNKLFPAELVRGPISTIIQTDLPGWVPEGYICLPDLNRYRSKYIETMLSDEQGELNTLDKEVAESMITHETVSKNLVEINEERTTFSERLSDRIAVIGGSWGFIISFAIILVLWIVSNSIILLTKAFDPYPYILLNLVLSTVAALQAPLIMMSQRRQEARDRRRAENDYRINLKAELEIRHLHEKVDHLLSSQWHRLMEIQSIQIELMNELRKTPRGRQPAE